MKTVKLKLFREDPDNVSEATDEEIARLAGKLKRVPAGLTAMRIAYVTDAPGGGRMVISGNKRLRCLKAAYGEDGEVPADWFQDVTAMSEAERHEFRLNANVSDGHWNIERLLSQYDKDELGDLLNPKDIDDMLAELNKGESATSMETEETEESRNFEEKFVPKRTTDDCYTPENIYAEVLDWAASRYGINKAKIVRPFFPGGDYRAAKYPDGYTVVDNPPFSIFSEIIKFYCERNIPFFLFGPALTLSSSSSSSSSFPVTYIVCNVTITYANGAGVNTSFVTNLEPATVIRVAGDLSKRLEAINAANRNEKIKETKKHIYPAEVVSTALLGKVAIRGIELAIPRAEAYFVRQLDEQKATGDAIFGGGFILSERAAAERAAAFTWKLSPREREIQKRLGAHVDNV